MSDSNDISYLLKGKHCIFLLTALYRGCCRQAGNRTGEGGGGKWVNATASDSEKASWSETDNMGWDLLKDFSTLCKRAVKKGQVKAISRIYSNICSFLGLLMRISILTFGFTKVLHNFLLNFPLTGYRHNSILITLNSHNVERQGSFLIFFVE